MVLLQTCLCVCLHVEAFEGLLCRHSASRRVTNDRRKIRRGSIVCIQKSSPCASRMHILVVVQSQATELLTTLPHRSRNMLLCKCLQQKSRREYKQSRTLINVTSADRGSLDDRSLCGTGNVCHLDVISSLFCLSVQHLPTELMQASSADNNTRHTFTSVLANIHIKLLPPPRPPSPAALSPPPTPPSLTPQ